MTIDSSKIARFENEDVSEYISRICSYKDIYQMSWFDIRDICNTELGVKYSESYYRKNYAAGIFQKALTSKIIDSSTMHNETCSNDYVDADLTEEEKIQEKIDNLNDILKQIKEERIKLADERTSNNAALRRLVREDTCKEIALQAVEKFNEKKILESPTNDVYLIPQDKKFSNKAIVTICDWHYGMEFSNHWNTFNPEICIKRINKLLDKVISKCYTNNVDEIYLVNLGDLIAGRIHAQIRIQSRFDVITQIMQVSEIVAEFINNLTLKGFKVNYYDCLDNHSRVEADKNVSMDLESLARITPWYLQERLKTNDRASIFFNQYTDDIITFNCLNYRIGGVHGDKDKPARVIENINLLTKEHMDLILTAHLHHFSGDEGTDTLVISSGSLMGADDYSINLRKYSKPSQNIIIVTPENVCDDLCRVTL